MANLKFIIERTDRLPQFAAMADAEAHRATVEANKVRKAAVERNAPRDQGVFSGSIATDVGRQNEFTRGDVFSTDNQVKVSVIENGLGAGHFPSLSAIRDWADRKGIPLFVAARAIARKGIKPRHVFERSADETQAEVESILLSELPGRMAERL